MVGVAAEVEGSDVQRKDDVAKLETLLAEGKQAYISNRLKEAEEKLSEASELSVDIYGYFAVQTFEPHFFYGKTLHELARMEDSVFSNALQGIAAAGEASKEEDDEKDESAEDVEPVTEEERAEIAEKVGEALEENAEALEKKVASCRVDSSSNKEGDEKKTEPDAEEKISEAMETDKDSVKKEQTEKCEAATDEKSNGGDEVKTANGKAENGEAENEKGDKGEAMEQEEESKDDTGEVEEEKEEEDNDETSEDKEATNNDDDVDYLQLAWENLEVARTICDRHLEEEGWKKKKVEVLLDLADCSTDEGNYKQAVEDIDASILLMESIFEEDDRRIAQAYYMKGRTFSFAKDFEHAAKVFEKSKATLETRLAKLEADYANGSEKEGAKDIKEEIDEIKPLILEMQEKIDDAVDSAKSLTKGSISVAKGDTKNVELEAAVKEMPVDDVTSLVRKKTKRQATEEPEKEVKRAKGDDSAAENVADNPDV